MASFASALGVLVKSRSFSKTVRGLLIAAALAFSMVAVVSPAASADVPHTPAGPFSAPSCAGDTHYNPTENTGFAVLNLLEMFGERLTSYNNGNVVPLYDAFGGSVLLRSDGTNTGETAYPPLCGTRYVESLGTAVSEWMYCTDRDAQTCGDTDEFGNLVDKDGDPINPMTGLPTNPKLNSDQEKLIAYLVQHGHSYAGVGNQSWNGATEARSDLGSDERAALQTLVWCVSDPAADTSDFAVTCENNMNAAEQARILAMIPEVPELVLSLDTPAQTLVVGEVAEFTLTTNVFNQLIEVTTGGSAAAAWTVCSGDATLSGTSLVVSGSDPTVSKAVVLCATSTAAGTATIAASAVPASTQNIGWSQSVNALLTNQCQVYATFHEVNMQRVIASSDASFEVRPDSGTPVTGPKEIAETGDDNSSVVLVLGATLLLAGLVLGVRRFIWSAAR